MTITDRQAESFTENCCIEYCSNHYKLADQEVVNNYRCNQQPFSTADLWRIRRNKRAIGIRNIHQ